MAVRGPWNLNWSSVSMLFPKFLLAPALALKETVASVAATYLVSYPIVLEFAPPTYTGRLEYDKLICLYYTWYIFFKQKIVKPLAPTTRREKGWGMVVYFLISHSPL